MTWPTETDESGFSGLIAECQRVTERARIDSIAVALGWGQSPLGVLASSGPLAVKVAEWDVVCGQGPRTESILQRTTTSVGDMASPDASHRWPAFCDGSIDFGARSVWAVPLIVGDVVVGSLVAVATDRAMPDRLATVASVLQTASAGVAKLVLHSFDAGSVPLAPEPTDPILIALHQAAGMIAGRLDISIEDALSAIRAMAFSGRVPLDELARRITSGPEAVTNS